MAKILLLGSGWPRHKLHSRDNVGRKLEQLGHKPIIMEYTKQTTKPLHLQFDELTKKNYDAIVAIYFDKTANDAVHFELGFLTCKYIKTTNLFSKIYILTHSSIKKKELTSYLRDGLFYSVIHDPFNQKKELVSYINRFVKSR